MKYKVNRYDFAIKRENEIVDPGLKTEEILNNIIHVLWSI